MTVVGNGVKNIINDVFRDNMFWSLVGFNVNRCGFLPPNISLKMTVLQRSSSQISWGLEGRSRKKEWTRQGIRCWQKKSSWSRSVWWGRRTCRTSRSSECWRRDRRIKFGRQWYMRLRWWWSYLRRIKLNNWYSGWRNSWIVWCLF